MAKIPFGILGPFIGKVGPVIGYMHGDTWCIRSMPSHYRDARTPAQLVNRSKMTRLMQFLCSMKPVIQSSFDVLNSNNPCRTEFNMAFAANFNNALFAHPGGTEILYPKIQLADGLLPTLSGANTYQDGNKLHISWASVSSTISTSASKFQSAPIDHLCICAHNSATGKSVWNLQSAFRRDGNAVFSIPQNWTDNPIHLWAWFSSPISTSPSIYLGEFAQTTQKQNFPQPDSRHPLSRGMSQTAGAHIRQLRPLLRGVAAQPTGYVLNSSEKSYSRPLLRGVARRAGVCIEKKYSYFHSTISNRPTGGHVVCPATLWSEHHRNKFNQASNLHSTIYPLQSPRISRRPRAPMNKNNQASKVLPKPYLLRPSSLPPHTPNLPEKPPNPTFFGIKNSKFRLCIA